ncbi:MAG: hypothetical protein Q8L14_26265 [Myxococcales bacterium]|nr:hypothetical protein [Myxococcales bacterium]
MAVRGFEVTAVYVSGFRKALVDLGLLEQVEVRLQPSTKAVLDAPHSARTHDADVLRDLSDVLFALSGKAVFQQHAYLMARDSLGKILIPMFKVALALTGRSPATLLARVPDSVHQAMRGVTATWQPDGPNRGALVVDYPEPIALAAEDGWRGTLKFLFELVEGTPATISKVEHLNGNQRLSIHVAW